MSRSGHARPRRWAALGLGALVLAVAALVGTTLIAPHSSQRATSPEQPGTASPAPGTPWIRLPAPSSAPPVLDAVSTGVSARPGELRRLLTPLLTRGSLGHQVGFAAAPLGDPDSGWRYGVGAVMPASTMKLLTTTAALQVLGPQHRFTTSVVRGPQRGSIVLVGGGDPLLAVRRPPAADGVYPREATLQLLAQRTAARLAEDGVTRVRLAYDTSLFSGPAVNPAWPKTYVPEDVVSPIESLWVNEGRERAGYAARSADPAEAAATDFSRLLTAAGVTVVGEPTETTAAHGAPLAGVESAPLVQIVQHILEVSDNEGAEVLLRQVAVATGQPGSSAAGVAAVRAVLGRLGLDVSGLRSFDGSGLSRRDLVPVDLLLNVLQLDAEDAHPTLRGVITGLPVAGFSGSLAYRFQDDAGPGLGYVAAKTGTLTGVDGLAGIATTRSGQALVFVAVADRVPIPDTLDARADLDQIAAALAGCGC